MPKKNTDPNKHRLTIHGWYRSYQADTLPGCICISCIATIDRLAPVLVIWGLSLSAPEWLHDIFKTWFALG